MDDQTLTGLLAFKRAEIQQIESDFIERCERAASRTKADPVIPAKRTKSAWRRYISEAIAMQHQFGGRICAISHEINTLEQRAI
jgi:hypothetical protein